jgi:cholesterol transport system auxiliary component
MKKALALIALTTLSACSLGIGGKPPAFLLTLTPNATISADEGRLIKAGEAILIGTPIVPQAIATTRVPVADGRNAIAYVKDAAWVEPPAKLFQRLLAETVRVRTGRPVLDARQNPDQPGAILSSQLLHFGVDAPRSEAVVVFEAMISRGKDTRVRRFEARTPVAVVDAAASGAALNRAANMVADQVADWIGR